MTSSRSTDPPTELFVVGEHADNPGQLLLQDSDGNYYAYEAGDGDPHPVDIDETWTIESHPDDVVIP